MELSRFMHSIPDSNIELSKDADEFSAEYQMVIGEYANAVGSDFRSFIDRSIASKGLDKKSYPLSDVTPHLAHQIQKLIGVNPDGYKIEIEPNRVQHIWKYHGENGIENRSMANRDDIARMKYVIDNPDKIEEDTDPNHTKVYRQPHPYLEGESKASKTILISKKVNGTYYVVEAVPDSAKNCFYCYCVYGQQKKDSLNHR